MTDTTAPAVRRRKLTERQARFVEAYASSGNASEAARAAGYSDANIGRQLIANHNVRLALKKYAADRAKNATMTRAERESFFAAVAKGIGPGKNATLRERLRAAELLGKMNGDFATVNVLVPPGASATVQPGDSVDDDDAGEPVVVVYLPDNGRGPPPIDVTPEKSG